jgi:molybdopterin molybdotransferase
MATSFERAREIILDRSALLQSEPVALMDLSGRVLAEDIVTQCELPRWNNSAMDGFAVSHADNRVGAQLKIIGYIPAGAVAGDLNVVPGTAIKIMTGAPTPQGCQAVLPIEDTEYDEDTVTILQPFKMGDHIRVKGEDIPKNEVILTTGTVLRPAAINLLATLGFTTVKVFKKPKVAILSTGDELVEPGETVGAGQITNSNAYSIAAAVKEAGGEPILLGIARDNRESLQQKLSEGLKAEVLITSAGISMGDRDLVCDMLNESGVEQIFWKVDIKPGRPTAFAVNNGKLIFSLPGNPVSTMVTFEEFVRPALLKMQGHLNPIKDTVKATLTEAAKKKEGRVQFLRVFVSNSENGLIATSSGDQNTGILSTMIRANGIAILPANRDRIEAGETVDIQMI